MNTFNLQLKRLGKKRIKTVDVNVATIPETLSELIIACVQSQVQKYNEKREGEVLISFLTPGEIEEQSTKGKMTFGDIENKKLAEENKAIEQALEAFTDGLFLVFIDDEEITEINTKITLTDKSNITFIRMTFLTGTHW
ncbi:hypothetical protein GCM10022393_15870 [Aquimarina addita]|uniref:Uncharacterized protein n=1 Tax=Aquimarina addita TaxID=870485 RepID=A0ABP7XGQ9_9FLAO